MIGDILDRYRYDLRIVLNSEERETSIYMISTLPRVRHLWLGGFRDDIQFLLKY